MKSLFVFIDDAPFELENFQRNAAPAFERAEFIYAATFEQARQRIGRGRPVCFLLDLYGADPAVSKPAILPQAELAAQLAGLGRLEQVYEGLAEAQDAGNLFLRKLYAQVQAWQAAFLSAAGSLGQGRGYGQYNLGQVRATYPWAAAAAYSRKALYADAVALSLDGVDLVLQKPQGADDAAVAQATRRAAPDLARAAYGAVDRCLSLAALPWALPEGDATLEPGLRAALARALACLARPQAAQREPLGRALGQELDQASEFTGLNACHALAEWLQSSAA
jgi:hypothetical protein